ncbi:MAG: hypothetical protein PHI37_05525 [Candidatus Gracilibacteria bacterium]|nr:hypothetical protein [Candidatus Gracilibacteria bacterium]
MKKIIRYGIITIIILTNFGISYSNEPKTMSSKVGFELYQERVSLFCSEYKISDSSSEMIYLIDKENEFLNLDKTEGIELEYKTSENLDLAKEQYRKNMDDIYGCATNITYYKSLKLIKETLIKKNPELNSRLRNKLDEKIKQIETEINNNSAKCKITSEKDNSIIKKSVLKQTTYEFCKYNFYLEYLKGFNENLSSIDENLKINSNNDIRYILEKEAKRKQEIENEIEDINKIFPVVFKAYSEYENNITSHVLLELLREDYDLLREKLHKNLNPINQAVYKISNAMRK